MSEIIKQVEPVIDYSVRKLCVKPYPGHPKGCPNFNHKKGCPPAVKCFDEVYDLTKPVYAVVNQFDFGGHVEKMKSLHPKWSDRQLKCCLYWQTTARKQLLDGIKKFLKHNDNFKAYTVETCPEAMGVNVTETMRRAGVILEWPPKTVTYQVALVGIKKEESK